MFDVMGAIIAKNTVPPAFIGVLEPLLFDIFILDISSFVYWGQERIRECIADAISIDGIFCGSASQPLEIVFGSGEVKCGKGPTLDQIGSRTIQRSKRIVIYDPIACL
eukprot:scaffold208094_cov24-Attheya_sp.AAC.1